MIRQSTLLLVCSGAHLLLAQAPAQLSPQPAPATVTDTVAHAFTEARARAHLRPLTRIPDRPLLRQITCTASATNTPQEALLTKESQADGALFSVTDVARLPPDLIRVAEYDDRATARGRRITRFSVASFTSPSNPSLTWIGVALYWSRFTEYFALHLTRSYSAINSPVDIVPACRSIR